MEPVAHPPASSRSKYVAMAVLIMANMLNYMDRFTVAGVLPDLEEYFKMDNKQSGLLQTVFVISFMIFAPLCGYLGDRYNRKIILACGLGFWILAVTASTFIGPEHYYIFLTCRALVGIGESSYVTVAPTIIADSFTGRSRSTWLTIFYLMIPVGSGLGYSVGANVAILANNQWQWGVRVTPIMGIIVLLMIIFVMEIPERGAAEHAKLEVTPLKDDLLYLVTHKTFICTTLGLTATIFTTGALSWWTPMLFERASMMIYGSGDQVAISLKFGVITCIAGIAGVSLGSFLAEMWHEGKLFCKETQKAHTYICALGALLSLPFLFAALMLCSMSASISWMAWVAVFFAITFMCFNWAVNIDILMTVIVANRRALANSIQTLVSHALGDAASPYLVGVIQDAVLSDFPGNATAPSDADQFFALRNALFLPNAVLVLSVGGYLAASFFVEADSHEVEEHTMPDDDETRAIMDDQDFPEPYGSMASSPTSGRQAASADNLANN